MEGLIPLVCKAIKRNKTRRRYECLSSGAAQSYDDAATDFYKSDQTRQQKIGGVHEEENYRRQLQRRYSSVGDYASRFSLDDDDKAEEAPPPSRQQLERFRSHRMFSCVTTGAA